MAHYAFLDKNNIVVEVIVGVDEGSQGRTIEQIEESYASFKGLQCKKTSYNTIGGEHTLGGTPFRKNYAGIGDTYDESRDAFISPKPENRDSWTLNEETCLWTAPVEHPGGDERYVWDEENLVWVKFQEVTGIEIVP
jgi:hypothetical protein